ncbi:Nucleoside-diphosphate-sugar epimerase [Acidisarcina polymorpha]|uniref:Nucleoside-diphosphate-sugar epimerase n=1 Tax=Acidisarcina polymorpha TaxID=2211140 RepID=A0A2Z5FU35_9BACT|nr:SDR family oxidoreductase [Acidisarcina polymorpha]AXC09996.1 Nucleoside-diphosphate-sugar epimerase [Acidisarcina polymorpha]
MAKTVFLTGATGFIGTAIVSELINNGYQVRGLTRSEEGSQSLRAAGAETLLGDVNDLDALRKGAETADAVIHTAFDHDFSKYKQNCEADRKVIEALGAVLVGSNRPFVVTSGTSVAKVAPGEVATEQSPALDSSVVARAASEEAAAAVAKLGVSVRVVRNSQVHDTRKQGLVSFAIDIARKKGSSAYVGDGGNRWSAVHLSDTALLYRLALEKGEAGGVYHAVAEEGVAFREIAETIGKGLNLPVNSLTPEEANAHFSWFAPFVGRANVVSSKTTQKQLAWQPAGAGLIADLCKMYNL